MDPNELLNSEDMEESLWESPAKPLQDRREVGTKQAHSTKPTYEEQQEREASLRQEWESVRQVNEALEGVIQSLNKAKSNMEVRRYIADIYRRR